MKKLTYDELIKLVWAIQGFPSMAATKEKLQAEIDQRDGDNIDE